MCWNTASNGLPTWPRRRELYGFQFSLKWNTKNSSGRQEEEDNASESLKAENILHSKGVCFRDSRTNSACHPGERQGHALNGDCRNNAFEFVSFA